jgi:hypothetical protein
MFGGITCFVSFLIFYFYEKFIKNPILEVLMISVLMFSFGVSLYCGFSLIK